MIVVQNLEELLPPGFLDAFSDPMIDSLLANIAESALDKWRRLAGEGLFTSRRDYLAGLQPIEFHPGTAVLSLVGVLPYLIENGMAEKDLHDVYLGPNVPVVPPGQRGKHVRKKGGYYRAIPFRHSVPGAGGAVGQPMGRAYRNHDEVSNFRKLGREVYGQAKELSPTTTNPYGKTTWGGRLPAGLAPKLKPHHHSDIYAGMVRQEKTYAKATQSQYTTFRMISTGSPGWIRPATPGVKFADQVAAHVAKIAPEAFQAFVEGLGG